MAGQVNSVEQVSWHRNGVSGVGFHAVLFRSDVEPLDAKLNILGINDPAPPLKNARFLGIVFDEPGCCAVICLDRIESCGIEFARGNSWRGDNYEPELRQAIAAADAGRCGPFSIPTAALATPSASKEIET